MPFLRVIRDKRGYETTYLMHWYREGNRPRSRILYVFRTPAGVRVGRSALEPDVLRHIEAQHPDIVFDWNVVRENQQVVEPPMEQRRRRPRRDEDESDKDDKRDRAEKAERSDKPDRSERADRSEKSDRSDKGAKAAAPAASPSVSSPPPSAPAPSVPPLPAAIEGATPAEQIAFLNEWYPALRQRIAQRTSDPARLEALLALTERVNPAAWTDADTMTSGLQQAGEAWERLAHVFAKRRRRTRRRSSDARPAAVPPPPAES